MAHNLPQKSEILSIDNACPDIFSLLCKYFRNAPSRNISYSRFAGGYKLVQAAV
jgi:hypothetical protein